MYGVAGSIGIGISIVFVLLLMKNSKFAKVKDFFNKLFWINELEGESKFLLWSTKLFVIAYLLIVPFLFVSAVILLDYHQIILAFVIGVLAPAIYRVVVGFQRSAHRV